MCLLILLFIYVSPCRVSEGKNILAGTGGQREGDVSEDVKWQLSSVSKLKTIIVCYANN